tara:strand:+ start:196 stop:435 length:240 start_codon:yes stop_codon:yes gene_type:complete
MKIKYNKYTNEMTIDLGDSVEFETDIHEFDDESVLTITVQENKNSLIAQLKKGTENLGMELNNVSSLKAFLREHNEDDS